MASLTFLSGPAAGLRREVAGRLTIGRSRACDVALDDDQVSRQHARIERQGGELKILDLGSRNGTRVNGRRINAEVALQEGDRIQLGTSSARLELDARFADDSPILVGAAPNVRRMLEKAASAALSDERVTIFGETGTGRLLLARHVHAVSRRASGPFVTVNCAAHGDVEEALFGAEERADSRSAFRRAQGGTLVLRHVELLPRMLGQRLAQLLLDRQASAADPDRVDVRTIALGRDPQEVLAARRRIPRELANALVGAAIEVPALRDRSADVPALFQFFAHGSSEQIGREPPRLSAEAKRALIAYAWPGNVAELRLLAERQALLYPALEISVARLPPEMVESNAGGKAATLHTRVRALERAAIAEALSAARGKKIRAAQILGISRPTLDKKLKELHLAWSGLLEREG